MIGKMKINMKTICICGRFGSRNNRLQGGQGIKTKIVEDEIIEAFGRESIKEIHTGGSIVNKILVPYKLFFAVRDCEDIIIMPAQNGLAVIAPTLSFLNKYFHRNLHYVVVGGWLPEYLLSHKKHIKYLSHFKAIYVETESMVKALADLGLTNVMVMYNCKKLDIIPKNEIQREKKLRFCTFSRVMKEKGIEDAVAAIKQFNAGHDCKIILDIYGKVDESQIEWFQSLRKTFTSEIDYKGIVQYSESTKTLKNYYALIFPTYYEGEGFAGTLIDAMAAGVPAIVSDWKYNTEIVIDGINGIIFKTKDVDDLCRSIEYAIANKDIWEKMSINCVEMATKYLPSNALNPLISSLSE